MIVCCGLCNAIWLLRQTLHIHGRLESMLKATFNGDDVRRAIADLKEIDPKMEIFLKREIRSGLAQPAAAIQKAWPIELEHPSGLNRLQKYVAPKATVSVTPGIARRGRVSTLVGIRVKMPKGQPNAWIAEMAGLRGDYKSSYSREYTRNGERDMHRLNGQGDAMVQALNQKYGSASKGGRFGWRKFVNMKGNIQNIGLNILEDYVSKLNRES